MFAEHLSSLQIAVSDVADPMNGVRPTSYSTAVSATASGDAGMSLRDRAVMRSLEPARATAERRVQCFLDMATDLLSSDLGNAFTVQDVVSRSGLSFRQFYGFFGGKYDLQLAVLESWVLAATEHCEHHMAHQVDPLSRLRSFVFACGQYSLLGNDDNMATDQKSRAQHSASSSRDSWSLNIRRNPPMCSLPWSLSSKKLLRR